MSNNFRETIKSVAESYLDAQLTGFWAADVWHFSEYPALPHKLKGDFDFRALSPRLRSEIKYACCLNFSQGAWTLSSKALHSRANILRQMIEFLQLVAESVESLMDFSVKEWEDLIALHREEQFKRERSGGKPLHPRGKLRSTKTPQALIYAFHTIYNTVERGYFDASSHSEYERDVWELRMLIRTSPTDESQRLNFSKLQQSWLREAAKKFIRYRLNSVSAQTCSHSLIALGDFSQFLRSEFPTAIAEDIDRPAIVQYLKWLADKDFSAASHSHYVTSLQVFFVRCAREGWAHFPATCRFYEEDRPRVTRPKPRSIPAEILRQLYANAHALPLRYLRMLQIISDVGMRIGELRTLRLDCLRPDTAGNPYLTFYQGKMSRERSVPITQTVAGIIHDQIRETIEGYGSSAGWLFPNTSKLPRHRSKPVGTALFINALNKLANDKRILDANGAIYKFESHQFRHTLITDMVNRGVPLRVVQKFMDHSSAEMTMRYAHIADSTMRAKYDQTKLGRGIRDIDIVGRAVNDIPADADIGWLKKNILSQALPNGRCGLPIIGLQRCPHANACLTCDHFRTNASFIEVHKNQYTETMKILDTARSHGWQRQVEVNEEVAENLSVIIRALEEVSTEGTE